MRICSSGPITALVGLENTTVIVGGEVIAKPGGKAGPPSQVWTYEICGAIGACGGTAAEDEAIARLGAKVVQDILWPGE